MTELILANPTLMAIVLVAILFAFGNAITTRKACRLRVMTVTRQRHGAEADPDIRLPRSDHRR